MATANPYDPKSRIDGLQVLYKVNATGDRWFIPYNETDEDIVADYSNTVSMNKWAKQFEELHKQMEDK